jgi:hypothetical protein
MQTMTGSRRISGTRLLALALMGMIFWMWWFCDDFPFLNFRVIQKHSKTEGFTTTTATVAVNKISQIVIVIFLKNHVIVILPLTIERTINGRIS